MTIRIMKLRYALTITLFCSLTVATAQQRTVSGTVLDKTTNEPIPYASVYLASMKNGIYSFENGSFKLNCDTPNDTVVISAIGYLTFKDRAANLKTKGNTILLEPSVVALDEVVVTPNRKVTKRILGKFSNTNCSMCSSDGGLDTLQSVGEEFIHFMVGTDKSVKINKVFIKCRKENKRLEAIFILRFYAKNEDGSKLPGKLINKSPIVRSFTKTTGGALVFNIENEGISLPPEGLFVSFEHIGYKPCANMAELIKANYQLERDKEVICELYYRCQCISVGGDSYSLCKRYYNGKYHYGAVGPDRWKLSVKLEITEMR